jgi:AcrR family transcriptional regulator
MPCLPEQGELASLRNISIPNCEPFPSKIGARIAPPLHERFPSNLLGYCSGRVSTCNRNSLSQIALSAAFLRPWQDQPARGLRQVSISARPDRVSRCLMWALGMRQRNASGEMKLRRLISIGSAPILRAAASTNRSITKLPTSPPSFSAVSTHMITDEADANGAAMHCHFGSKEALIRAIFDRRLGPVNDARQRPVGQEITTSPTLVRKDVPFCPAQGGRSGAASPFTVQRWRSPFALPLPAPSGPDEAAARTRGTRSRPPRKPAQSGRGGVRARRSSADIKVERGLAVDDFGSLWAGLKIAIAPLPLAVGEQVPGLSQAFTPVSG